MRPASCTTFSMRWGSWWSPSCRESARCPQPRAAWVCALLLAGVVLFSGSLYALAISGVRMLGAVTPFGGLAFIAAWVLLAYWLLTAP